MTRFEKTNEMLVNCNALAAIRFDRASRDLRAHCQILEELKKDMEVIFRRIRSLRTKLSHDLPDAFTGNNFLGAIAFMISQNSKMLQLAMFRKVWRTRKERKRSIFNDCLRGGRVLLLLVIAAGMVHEQEGKHAHNAPDQDPDHTT